MQTLAEKSFHVFNNWTHAFHHATQYRRERFEAAIIKAQIALKRIIKSLFSFKPYIGKDAAFSFPVWKKTLKDKALAKPVTAVKRISTIVMAAVFSDRTLTERL